MPLYVYRCPKCKKVTEKWRRVSQRRIPLPCKCGSRAVLTISRTTVNAWHEDWKFPNLSPKGDGTRSFKNEREYKAFLRENHFGEVSLGIKEQ